jgi:hypothetical protein
MITEWELEPAACDWRGINAFLHHRKEMVNSRFTENINKI